MVEFSTCPDCGEGYPLYYSPEGSFGTRCAMCGYTSDAVDGEERT